MSDDTIATAHPARGDYAFDDPDYMFEDDEPEFTDSATETQFAPAPHEDKFKRLLFGDKTEKSRRSTPSYVTNSIKVRVIAIALWAFVVLGALGGIYSFFSGASSKTAAVAAQPDATGAQGQAVLYLRTYFMQTGDGATDALGRMYPGVEDDFHGVKAGQYYPLQIVPVNTTYVSNGYWSVVLAASVMKFDNGYKFVPDPLYYRVSIKQVVIQDPNSTTQHFTYVATSLPSLVAAPVNADTSSAPHSLVQLGGIDDKNLDQTTLEFFKAYLTDQNEIARYISSDSPIRDIQPAPAVSVEIVNSGSAQSSDVPGAMVVRAIVKTTDKSGLSNDGEYYLLAVQQNSKWVIKEILPAAPIDGQATKK